MKVLAIVVLAVVIYTASGFPQQKDGAAYSDEAVVQAKNSNLIPHDAQIQTVQAAQEFASQESIPGNQRIVLDGILRDLVPQEVIENLQVQIDQVGKSN